MPLYIFHGKDTFSMREELARLSAELDTEGMLATNTIVFDGSTVVPEEVIVACQTPPFFGAHRLILVERLLSRFNSAGRTTQRGGERSQPLQQWRPLAEVVEVMPPSTVLLLVDEEVDAQNPLLRLLSPKAQVRQFRPLGPQETPAWLKQRAQAMGVPIAPGAVRLLVDLVGANLWALDGELKKLAAYTNGLLIQEEDVRSVAAAWQEAGIFSLADAVVDGRSTAAFQQLRGLTASGKAPAYILSMLARHYRLLVLAKEAGPSASRPDELATRLGLSTPLIAKRAAKQASRYTLRQLVAAYQKLLETDAAIKRGIYSEETALEIVIGDLCNLVRPSPYHSSSSSSSL